jgi:hypothetical protein
VRHRTNCYLNNRLEQDHRGIQGPKSTDAGLQKGRIRKTILPQSRDVACP